MAGKKKGASAAAQAPPGADPLAGIPADHRPPKGQALAGRARLRDHLKITREGWFFLAITVALGLAAIRSGNNLLFLILGMLLGLLLLSGVLSEMALRGLTFSRVPPSTIHAVKPFLMGITVTNAKRWFPSFSLEVEDILEGRVLDKRCFFLKIPAGRTQHTAYRHAFPRRGATRCTGFKVSTKFPFALLRKSRIVALETEILVLPAIRPVVLPPLPAPDHRGQRPRAERGRGGDIYGVRDLRPGDDLRDVHWRSSAHRGRLILREREAETAREVILRLDHRLDLEEGRSPLSAAEEVEGRITRAASLTDRLIQAGFRVGLTGAGVTLATDEGPAQRARLLSLLARLPYADDPPAPVPPRGGRTIIDINQGRSHRALPATEAAPATGNPATGDAATGQQVS